jgi:hypothetical protein
MALENVSDQGMATIWPLKRPYLQQFDGLTLGGNLSRFVRDKTRPARKRPLSFSYTYIVNLE